MKLWILVTLFIGAFCAWDQEDYELFDLNDSLQQQFPGSTFYSILEVEPTADDREITKQYRKKSLSLHPDKNPSEEAGKLYALLTSISKILKDEEFRKRYDGHLKKGFPSWKGTGYYYTRYKPGFLTAVLAILVFVSVGQYITLWIFYNRD
ncbi:DnaJ domain-containing protein, partial [Gorgonomyces haynaldii]